jgi:hypothetical protein
MRTLANKGASNPLDIITEIKVDISNKNLDLFIKELFKLDMIGKPHVQSKTYSLPDYDHIVISEKGKQMVKELKTK